MSKTVVITSAIRVMIKLGLIYGAYTETGPYTAASLGLIFMTTEAITAWARKATSRLAP